MGKRKPKKVYIVVELAPTGTENAIARINRKSGFGDHRAIDADNRTRTAAKRSAIAAELA